MVVLLWGSNHDKLWHVYCDMTSNFYRISALDRVQHSAALAFKYCINLSMWTPQVRCSVPATDLVEESRPACICQRKSEITRHPHLHQKPASQLQMKYIKTQQKWPCSLGLRQQSQYLQKKAEVLPFHNDEKCISHCNPENTSSAKLLYSPERKGRSNL